MSDNTTKAARRNRIWFDTEFIEDGSTIQLLSIGMVRDDGVAYYAEPAEVDLSKASPWVRENVLPYLSGHKTPRAIMAQELTEFAGAGPEFWAYFADYDWIALCQLFGTMMDLPTGWPMFCHDLKQRAGDRQLPEQLGTQHHALYDAVWARKASDYLDALDVVPQVGTVGPVIGTFNINDRVRVRLTEHGRKLHRADHDAFRNEHPTVAAFPYVPPTEVNGWSEWRAVDLMQRFGQAITMTGDLPFETVIEVATTPGGAVAANKPALRLALEWTNNSAWRALRVAKEFHTVYERLAPEFGYATREETREFDANSANGRLMQAVCAELLQQLLPELQFDEQRGGPAWLTH